MTQSQMFALSDINTTLGGDPRCRLASERHGWPGEKTIVVVQSCREINGKIEQETSFHLTSLLFLAIQLARIVRDYYGRALLNDAGKLGAAHRRSTG